MSEDADAIPATCARVESYLGDYGEAFSKVGEATYFAKRGSAVVGIQILPYLDDDALVHIAANVVEGCDLTTPGLLQELLEHNHQAAYGSFGISSEGMITLHHTLRGSTLDKDELLPAVMEVARQADDWDDKIIAKAGGKTAVDKLRERIQD